MPLQFVCLSNACRRTLAWLILAFSLLHLGLPACAQPSQHPNLLFLLADQWRGQALGFLGQEPVHTPNLDRLSTQGLVLTRCISSYPVCSPYRAMLMTGQFPIRNHVLANCNTDGAKYGYELPTPACCWSDVLKSQGYSLGYIGKWHLDNPHRPYVDTSNNSATFAWNEWTPPTRRHGFDFWYAYGTYDVHLHPQYWTTDATRDQRTKVDQSGPEHEADLAIRYLRNEGGKFRDPQKPFALVVSMNPPHTGYRQVPQKYVDLYTGKTWKDLLVRPDVKVDSNSAVVRAAKNDIKYYFACMSGVDEQIGRVLAALKAEGLENNTLVVFTSDHGNCIGSHNVPTKNVPWDESLIVPFIIRWPGHIQARRDDLLLTPPDIYPTLLDLMGFGGEIPATVQGTSYTSIFRDGTGHRPASAWYMWVPYGHPDMGRRGVRTPTYTLVWHRESEGPDRAELYDDATDPFQLYDIAPTHPELVKKLTAEQLEPWLRKMDDPWLKRRAERP